MEKKTFCKVKISIYVAFFIRNSLVLLHKMEIHLNNNF